MTRRRSARGTVTTSMTSRGLWRARVPYTDPRTGEYARKEITSLNQKDLKLKVEKFQELMSEGLLYRDASVRVKDWISHWEKSSLEASNRKESTKELYRGLVRVHLKESDFGLLKLSEVRKSHIVQLFLELEAKGLSPSTRRSIYAVCNSIFDEAISDGNLAKNPVGSVKRPRLESKEAKFLTNAEVYALLEELKPTRAFIPITLIAMTGMRRGEVLGLEWSNIDFGKRIIRVRQTMNRVNGKLIRTDLKTLKSKRDIYLSDSVESLLREQKIEQMKERLKLGPLWNGGDLVFTTELGQAIDGRNLLRIHQKAATRAGIEVKNIHALRHSAATSLLDAQVPALVVSRILGHSSVGITLDIYGHVIEETAKDALEALDKRITNG
jgi:integrase